MFERHAFNKTRNEELLSNDNFSFNQVAFQSLNNDSEISLRKLFSADVSIDYGDGGTNTCSCWSWPSTWKNGIRTFVDNSNRYVCDLTARVCANLCTSSIPRTLSIYLNDRKIGEKSFGGYWGWCGCNKKGAMCTNYEFQSKIDPAWFKRGEQNKITINSVSQYGAMNLCVENVDIDLEFCGPQAVCGLKACNAAGWADATDACDNTTGKCNCKGSIPEIDGVCKCPSYKVINNSRDGCLCPLGTVPNSSDDGCIVPTCRTFQNYVDTYDKTTTLAQWCSNNHCCQGNQDNCKGWSTSSKYHVCRNSCNGYDTCKNLGQKSNSALITISQQSCIGNYACTGIAYSSTALENLIFSTGACNSQSSCTNIAWGSSVLKTLSLGEDSCSAQNSCTLIASLSTKLQSLRILKNSCSGLEACNLIARDSQSLKTIMIGGDSCLSYKSCHAIAFVSQIIQSIEVGEKSCFDYMSCYVLAGRSINLETLSIGVQACRAYQACYLAAEYNKVVQNLVIPQGECSSIHCQLCEHSRGTSTSLELTDDYCSKPIASCKANPTYYVDDGKCEVKVTVDEINDGSSDVTGIVGLSFSSSVSIISKTFSPGKHTVNLYVTDKAGNSNRCQTTVTVVDKTPPSAICKHFVNLSTNGPNSITVNDVNNGSSDNCSSNPTMILSKYDNFPIGTTEVTLTVTDTANLRSQCTTNVIVPLPPNPCQNNQCNGHGKCSVIQNKAFCECENTFQQTASKDGCECPSGLLLQSDINRCIDPCEGKDCNGHGDCDPTNGKCRCHESFIATNNSTLCECAKGYEVNNITKICAKVPDVVYDPTKCEDNTSFNFTSKYNPSFQLNCTWISKNSKRIYIRQHDYCFTDKKCESASDIGLECQQSCGFCDGSNKASCFHINGDPE